MKDQAFEGQGWIGIRMPNRHFTGVPGSVVSIPLVLRNQGVEQDYFELALEGLPGEWLTLPTLIVRLFPGEQKEVSLAVQLPASSQTQIGLYPFTLRISSQQSPNEVLEVKASLTIAAFDVQGPIGMLLQATHFTVNPGNSISFQVVLLNRNTVEDRFRLSVEGIPAHWVSIPSPLVRLAPGEQQPVKVTIRPPRSPHSRAGRHVFIFRATSHQPPERTAQASCTLTIAAFTQFSSEVIPRRVETGKIARVTIRNQGNIQETLTLTFHSQDGELLFKTVQPRVGKIRPPLAVRPTDETSPVPSVQVSPAAAPAAPEPGGELVVVESVVLHVPAGQAASLEFIPVLRKQPILGGEFSHAYTVEVLSVEKQIQSHEAFAVSRGLFPVWAVPVVLGLCILMACAAVLVVNLNSYLTSVEATQAAAQNQTAVAQLALTQIASSWTPTFTAVPPSRTPTPLPPTATWTATPTSTPTVLTPTPTNLQPTSTNTPSPTPTPTITPIPIPIWNQGAIAFESNRENMSQIYVYDTKDTLVFRVTLNPGFNTQPTWSPDGKMIAFASNRDGNFEIYIIREDGTGLTNLTKSPADDRSPSWSPDGQWIAFSTNRDGNQEIYVMRPDGSDLHNLTNNQAEDYQPNWFIQQRIAFTSNRDGNQEIYLMNTDGSGQTNLSQNKAQDYNPAGARDGSRIAFTSNRDGQQEIYTMNLDGASQVNLTRNPAEDYYPTWSAKSQWIAFVSTRDGNPEIYVMKNDGSEPFNLTRNPAIDEYPAWH